MEQIENIDKQIEELKAKKLALIKSKEKPKEELPENVMKVSASQPISEQAQELLKLAEKGLPVIELVARGKAIYKAFLLIQCDGIKEKLKYKETIPTTDQVPDRKDPTKTFDMVGVRILMKTNL